MTITAKDIASTLLATLTNAISLKNWDLLTRYPEEISRFQEYVESLVSLQSEFCFKVNNIGAYLWPLGLCVARQSLISAVLNESCDELYAHISFTSTGPKVKWLDKKGFAALEHHPVSFTTKGDSQRLAVFRGSEKLAHIENKFVGTDTSRAYRTEVTVLRPVTTWEKEAIAQHAYYARLEFSHFVFPHYEEVWLTA